MSAEEASPSVEENMLKGKGNKMRSKSGEPSTQPVVSVRCEHKTHRSPSFLCQSAVALWDVGIQEAESEAQMSGCMLIPECTSSLWLMLISFSVRALGASRKSSCLGGVCTGFPHPSRVCLVI